MINSETSKTTSIDRTIMPPLGKIQVLEIDNPVKTELDNGMILYLIDGEASGVTRFDIVFDAGTAFQQKMLTASTVNSLLREGTKNHSSFEISKILDYHGAYLDLFANKDTAGISLYALTKYYDKLLPLIREIVSEALFPEQELQLHLERTLHEFKLNQTKIRHKAMLEYNSLMFGKNSPYGKIVEEKDFGNLQREDVVRFYSDFYVPQNAYLVLSGKIDKQLVSKINSIFGSGWDKKATGRFLPKVFAENCKENRLIIEKQDALQSAIRIGRTAIDKTHHEYAGFMLFNTLLGGYFGSRLMSRLREEKGLTYGVHSFVQHFKHAAFFVIATEVNARQTHEAIDEIFYQIEKLKTETVPEEELQLIKNYLYGTFLRGFDGPFAVADRFQNVKDFNLTFDFYKKHLDKLMKIKSKTIRNIANKYFTKDKLKLLVVGNIEGF